MATETDGHRVYLDCARCERAIMEPFNRYSGPVFFPHYRGGNNAVCRLIVEPDPDGDDHNVSVIPPGESIEDHLDDAVESWVSERRDQVEQMIGAELHGCYEALVERAAKTTRAA